MFGKLNGLVGGLPYFLLQTWYCSAGLGVLKMALQAVSRMTGPAADPHFFLLDKDVMIQNFKMLLNYCYLQSCDSISCNVLEMAIYIYGLKLTCKIVVWEIVNMLF